MALKNKTVAIPNVTAVLPMEKRINVFAAVSYILITVLVGLPVWWKTTEVYRAALPVDRINSLNNSHIDLIFNVKIFCVDSQQLLLANRIVEFLQHEIGNSTLHEKLHILFNFSVFEISADIKSIIQERTSIHKIDQSVPKFDGFNFFLIPSEWSLDGFSKDAYISSNQNVYLRLTPEISERHIKIILLQYFLNSDNLKSICREHFDKKVIIRRRKKQQKTTARQDIVFPQSSVYPEYHIELSLILPGESKVPIANDLIRDFQSYLAPVSQALQNLTKLHFTSQMLYTVDFHVEPKLLADNGSAYFYSSKQLPHLISGLETYLTSLESKHKVLRFLLYFTPGNKRPLLILDDKNRLVIGNSFLVTNWGGVIIVNLDNNGAAISSADIMDQLFSQIRTSIGFRALSNSEHSWLQMSTAKGFSEWDLNRLMIESTLDYYFGSVASLTSLTKLLAEITNIVISDHVAQAIDNSSLEALRPLHIIRSSTKMALDNSESSSLAQAHLSAMLARDQSEQAFFDESLLALLYFPDDQKYAIYVPLFLPALLPVVLSLHFVVKYFRGVE